MDRRQFIAAGGTALGTFLAGCTGESGSEGSPTGTTATSGTTTSTDAEAASGAETTESGSETASSGSYTVSMVPVGDVTFDVVPQTWVANNGSWADMGVALGLEPPKAVWMTSRYHTRYYEKVPGVSVDKSDMVSLYSDGVSKELFYKLNGDVHVIDPNFLMNRFKGWEQSDVDEIAENVAPFFGNSIFSRGYDWHNYQYYTLYEGFHKLSKLFRREKRYEAFASLHEEFQKKIDSALPRKSDRPAVAILWASGNQPETFLPYLINEGTSYKQWRDLRVTDALAETSVKDFHSARGQIDYETLLQVDPEVLLIRGHESQTAKEFQNTVVQFMKNHPVASQLQAVKNGQVYRGGPLYQGPITNLVLTERAANQLYPDAFADTTLYDPQRVANIVDGKV